MLFGIHQQYTFRLAFLADSKSTWQQIFCVSISSLFHRDSLGLAPFENQTALICAQTSDLHPSTNHPSSPQSSDRQREIRLLRKWAATNKWRVIAHFFPLFRKKMNEQQKHHRFTTIMTSWWFQPIWKILVKMGIFPNFRGENKTYLKPPPRMSYIHRDDIIHHFNLWKYVSNGLKAPTSYVDFRECSYYFAEVLWLGLYFV